MAKQAVQHNLIDPDIHLAVAADWQPREAVYLTTYDDGTTAETVQMLYWYVVHGKEGKGGEVRSCALEEWGAMQGDMMGDAIVSGVYNKTQDEIFAAAAPLVGKPINNISAPELNALLEVVIHALGGIDGQRNLIDPALWAARAPGEIDTKPTPH